MRGSSSITRIMLTVVCPPRSSAGTASAEIGYIPPDAPPTPKMLRRKEFMRSNDKLVTSWRHLALGLRGAWLTARSSNALRQPCRWAAGDGSRTSRRAWLGAAALRVARCGSTAFAEGVVLFCSLMSAETWVPPYFFVQSLQNR
jgi:hypothetical protein